MLVLLPPSESKATVRRGRPLDLDRLSFPALGAARAAVLDALVATSGRPDAMAMLGVPPTLEDVVRRNLDLRSAPTAEAEAVYTGVLYDALCLAELDPASRRRARAWLVVVSALFGAVRLADRIPPYRLSMSGRLAGLPALAELWRAELGGVLPAAAGRGLVVDCRSSDYVAAWRPGPELAARTVAVKVFRRGGGDGGGARTAVSHEAKRTRGLVARRIVEDGIDPRRPEQLAAALSSAFEVDLVAPPRPGRTWELHVLEPDAATPPGG